MRVLLALLVLTMACASPTAPEDCHRADTVITTQAGGATIRVVAWYTVECSTFSRPRPSANRPAVTTPTF